MTSKPPNPPLIQSTMMDVGGACPPDAERRLVLWCGPHPTAKDGQVPGLCGRHTWFLIDPTDHRICHCVVCGTPRDCRWKMGGVF